MRSGSPFSPLLLAADVPCTGAAALHSKHREGRWTGNADRTRCGCVGAEAAEAGGAGPKIVWGQGQEQVQGGAMVCVRAMAGREGPSRYKQHKGWAMLSHEGQGAQGGPYWSMKTSMETTACKAGFKVSWWDCNATQSHGGTAMQLSLMVGLQCNKHSLMVGLQCSTVSWWDCNATQSHCGTAMQQTQSHGGTAMQHSLMVGLQRNTVSWWDCNAAQSHGGTAMQLSNFVAVRDTCAYMRVQICMNTRTCTHTHTYACTD